MPTQVSPQLYWTLAAGSFALGACIGSFLNVVIHRLPLGISVGNPKRSFCPGCKYQIPFWLNIPLVSWLLLRGKCANCRAPISSRYFLVELFTALAFLAVFYLTWMPGSGNPYLMLPYWVLVSLFIAGTCIDIDHYILPDEITLGGTGVGLVFSLAVPMFLGQESRWDNFVQSLLGAAVGFGLLYLVVEIGKKLFGRKKLAFETALAWEIAQPNPEEQPQFSLDGDVTPWDDLFGRKSDRLILHCPEAEIDGVAHADVTLEIREDGVDVLPKTEGSAARHFALEQITRMKGTCDSVVIPREAMGLGDVKFMGLVGAFLGWKGVLFTVFAGSILGTAAALLLIAARRREWAQKVPFGPYLAAGATLYLVAGPAILSWYLGLSQPAE